MDLFSVRETLAANIVYTPQLPFSRVKGANVRTPAASHWQRAIGREGCLFSYMSYLPRVAKPGMSHLAKTGRWKSIGITLQQSILRTTFNLSVYLQLCYLSLLQTSVCVYLYFHACVFMCSVPFHRREIKLPKTIEIACSCLTLNITLSPPKTLCSVQNMSDSITAIIRFIRCNYALLVILISDTT